MCKELESVLETHDIIVDQYENEIEQLETINTKLKDINKLQNEQIEMLKMKLEKVESNFKRLQEYAFYF